MADSELRGLGAVRGPGKAWTMMSRTSDRSDVQRRRRSNSMNRMKHVLARVLFVAPLALAPALPARADNVDVEIRSSDKVSGTIRPTYDEECFVCDLAKN